MEAPASLLATKLYFPPARPNLVPRPRLIERLQAGLEQPLTLTLISAPAGFGKTSLMSEWRMGRGSRVSAAWLSLDRQDNDPSRFMYYLVSALEGFQNDSFDTTRILLQSPQPVPFETIISSILHELKSGPDDHILVLDDLHLITSPLIHQALACLLEHLPPQLHLVFLTRADPPLPLSRLRARNQLVELRAADLRFTVDEVSMFLFKTMGLLLTQEQIASLETRTEGWIAGLQLAALSLQGRQDVDEFVAAFTGSHHYVVDYLVEEVLSLQAEKVRTFLLKTSILERMSAPLCNALTGEPDGQAMLEELEQNNLFLVSLDNERRWYRYHHLFSDVLQLHLYRSKPGELNELHRRAAEWLERNGLQEEAFRQALAAGDQEHAGRLAEQIGARMLAHGELIAMLSWLETVKELVAARPLLCLDKAWALMLMGQMEEVEALLARAETLTAGRSAGEETRHVRGSVLAIRSYMASRSGNAIQGIELGKQALEVLPESDPGVRGVVYMSMGGAYILRGDFTSAIEAMGESGRLGKLADNYHVAVTAFSSVANILMEQGQLHRSEEMYRQALQLTYLPDKKLLPIAGRVYSGLCRLAYERNDLDAAFEYAMETITLGQKWGNTDSLVTSHVVLARIYQARGDTRKAEESIRAAEQLVHTRQIMSTSVEWVETTRIWLWLAQGNLDACEHWYKAERLNPHGKEIKNTGRSMIHVRILLAQGNPGPALKIISQLISQADRQGQQGRLIELLALEALAFQQNGDWPTASKTLQRGLILAEPQGYMRVFLDVGTPMEKLLRKLKVKGTSLKSYTGKLIVSFHDPLARQLSISSPQPLVEPLSERELEVLKLMADGRSNQEIATELVVAVGTVKKHVSNIFGKLNVDSRTRCIAQARDLHLIK